MLGLAHSTRPLAESVIVLTFSTNFDTFCVFITKEGRADCRNAAAYGACVVAARVPFPCRPTNSQETRLIQGRRVV